MNGCKVQKKRRSLPHGVMFNAYPDSIGKNLADTVQLLKRPELQQAFSMFYLLPTVFNSDLDRGFSIIDYNLNTELVKPRDLKEMQNLGIMLKLDLVLNHLSVNSPQFEDLLTKGQESEYDEFFIDWNKFWEGYGTAGADGWIIPDREHREKLFTRKPGLPVMRINIADGSQRYFWNTFYQKIMRQGRKERYLGQLDLNARSEKVWIFYKETLQKIKSYGAGIVRLDAFAYLHKVPGEANFFNRPGTWDYLERLEQTARCYDLIVLPEIHAEYGSGLYREIAAREYPFYDFFLPGLVIDALESSSAEKLLDWADEISREGYRTINMLGCHDGIPLLDLKGKDIQGSYQPGLLSDRRIDALVDLIVARGGRIKDIYDAEGKIITYYQVNATFFSALGEDDSKMLLARAIQLFMPGTPQVWYLDLFAGKNDYEAADRGGTAGHKEINRTNLSLGQVKDDLKRPVVIDQLEMIRLRNNSPAFSGSFETDRGCLPHLLKLSWQNLDCRVTLSANLKTYSFIIEEINGEAGRTFRYNR